MEINKLTKKELIQLAESKNIRFKKSSVKAEIIAAIESGVTNDDPIWTECKHTGLVFDAIALGVSPNTQVHPEIAAWLQSANRNKWYALCFEAFDYCKQKGFNTIEEIEAVLERAQAGKPFDSTPEAEQYNLELTGTGYQYTKWHNSSRKPWVAKITGLDEVYSYQRTFLEEVDKDGRNYKFNLVEDGYYQTKQYSGKGNEYIDWYKVESGRLIEISEADIKQVFGDPQELKSDITGRSAFRGDLETTPTKKQAEDKALEAQITDTFLNPDWEGEIYDYVGKIGDRFYKILKTKHEDVDIDGISADHPDSSGYFATDSYYFCRLATESEIEVYKARLQAQKDNQQLYLETIGNLRKIVNGLDASEIDIEPRGIQVTLQGTKIRYYTPFIYVDLDRSIIWDCLYNGRDGDDWSYNNWQGYMVLPKKFDDKVRENIEEILNKIYLHFPDAILNPAT